MIFCKLEHEHSDCYNTVVADGVGVYDFTIRFVQLAVPCRTQCILNSELPVRNVVGKFSSGSYQFIEVGSYSIEFFRD